MRFLIMILFVAACAPADQVSHLQPKWQNILKELPSGKPPYIAEEDKFSAIWRLQERLKKFRYVRDQELYGVSDYWATPGEFEKAGRGDCEDFAFEGWKELIEANFRPEDLRILLGVDYEYAEPHALLGVRVGQTWWYINSNNPVEIFPESGLWWFNKKRILDHTGTETIIK